MDAWNSGQVPCGCCLSGISLLSKDTVHHPATWSEASMWYITCKQVLVSAYFANRGSRRKQ